MNLVQAQVAHRINAHLKRERKLMPRDFPVDLFLKDVTFFVDDLVEMFSHQNNAFNKDVFISICLEGI